MFVYMFDVTTGTGPLCDTDWTNHRIITRLTPKCQCMDVVVCDLCVCVWLCDSLWSCANTSSDTSFSLWATSSYGPLCSPAPWATNTRALREKERGAEVYPSLFIHTDSTLYKQLMFVFLSQLMKSWAASSVKQLTDWHRSLLGGRGLPEPT